MKKICVNCGFECDDDSIFCSNCGKKIENNTDEEVFENVEETIVEDTSEIQEETITDSEQLEVIELEEQPFEEAQEETITDSEQLEVIELEEQPIEEAQEETSSDSQTIETFDAEVVSDDELAGFQSFSEEEEKDVEKFQTKYQRKIKKEKASSVIKTIFMVLWIIFGGLFNAVYIAISAVLECLSLVGIPFGIVLFKIIPLAFNPIGKRVKINFLKRPLFNILWIICGGWLVALIYQIYSLILIITVIGAPIGIQMQKIATLLWAPFGSQILKDNEFSDPIIEKEAYTIQYLRRNRISIIDKNLIYNSADKYKYEEIYSVKKPITGIFKLTNSTPALAVPIIVGIVLLSSRSYSLFTSLISKVVGEKIVNVINGISDKIASFFQGINNGYINIFANIIQKFPFDTSVIIEHIDLFATIIPLFALLFVLFLVAIISGAIAKKAYKRYDYGFATRKELITMYDNSGKRNNAQEDKVLKLYSLYQSQVDLEIEKDKKEQC